MLHCKSSEMSMFTNLIPNRNNLISLGPVVQSTISQISEKYSQVYKQPGPVWFDVLR